jgi:hypothetical protein
MISAATPEAKVSSRLDSEPSHCTYVQGEAAPGHAWALHFCLLRVVMLLLVIGSGSFMTRLSLSQFPLSACVVGVEQS